MKERIIFALIFLAAFIASIIIFFPLTPIASKVAASVIKSQNIPITYEAMNVTFFGADIKKLRADNVLIDNAHLSYNPIGLLFKRIKFKADSSLFQAEGRLAGNLLQTNLKASVTDVAKLFNQQGTGSLNADITFDIKEETGEIKLNSKKATFKTPMLPVDIDSLLAEATYAKNELKIGIFKAEGKTALDAKGSITLNKKAINRSLLNLSGKVGFSGQMMNFSLTGAASNPNFQLK